ncbi:MAG: hypothetical protein HC892_23035 [Saprospiraceae bacterium]|nr:hypothetical protein [Saprospiraceae bacterium]
MKSFIYSMVALLILVSCKNDNSASQRSADAQTATLATVSKFLTSEDVTHLLKIKTAFDKQLCGSATPDASTCYLSHAQEVAANFLNKLPYTNNFPYDGSFDLSKVEKPASQLSFLTKNCGFQDSVTNNIIHYYCLKSQSKLMDYFEALSGSSTLIKNFYTEYKTTKTISIALKERFTLDTQSELDFKQVDHQIFYMLAHLMFNEERIAYEKLSDL